MATLRTWFDTHGFVEITAPILTLLPLYEDSTALTLEVQGEQAFLTQCVGFYLESAVHSFERVYNIGPSFRGETSHGPRHLIEYWHVKAEIAFADLEDIIQFVEGLIQDVISLLVQSNNGAFELGETCEDGLRVPYRRIAYRDLVSFLRRKGNDFPFGKTIGPREELLLEQEFGGPFWIVGLPRSSEPFPYVVDPSDERVTRTADLIAGRGYGELLGVAEKIHERRLLDERLQEKGKAQRPEYEWVKELRDYGCVPHVGFGMGFERLLRWLLCLPHVRDAIPFPRLFGRSIYP